MKRVIFIVLGLLLAMPGAMAFEPRKDGYVMSVNANFGLKVNEFGAPDESKYWGLTLTGGYRKYMVRGLYLQPQVSVFFEDHSQFAAYFDYPGSGDVDIYIRRGGLGIGGQAGYTLLASEGNSLEFSTGPYLNCSIFQKQKFGTDLRRLSLRWRFGLAYFIGRVGIQATFDLSMLHIVEGYRDANVLSGGLVYRF